MGMGDVLMAIGDAGKLFEKDNTRKIAIGNGKRHLPHELYYGLPYIATQADMLRKVNWVISDNSMRPYVDYDQMRSLVQQKTGQIIRNRHLVGILGFYIWHRKYRATPADFVMQKHEEALFEEWKGREYVVIEPHLKTRAPVNKDWGFERYQEVVRQLAPHIEVVQVSASGHRPLIGATRFNGSFRDALVLIKGSRMFIGPEGGLHHGAAAVRRPAVVIFGGFIGPKTTGYDFHRNMVGDPQACGRKVMRCNHCQIAMSKITPSMVMKEINGVLDQAHQAPYVDPIKSGHPGKE